jgi:hypothetical protein
MTEGTANINTAIIVCVYSDTPLMHAKNKYVVVCTIVSSDVMSHNRGLIGPTVVLKSQHDSEHTGQSAFCEVSL